MNDRIKEDEPLLDLHEEQGLEHLDSQVQKAQEQLLQLRRQQELIEKQKRELEELSRRQDQLQQGRTEMVEQFTRSLVIIEREAYDAQKRVEQLRTTRDAFSQHLEMLEAINPKSWDPGDINRELNRALSTVDDARAEYSKARAVLNATAASSDEVLPQGADSTGVESVAGSQDFDFLYWLKCGFAFTLPLILLGICFLVMSLLSGK
jgi:chromosome segregation ATPase